MAQHIKNDHDDEVEESRALLAPPTEIQDIPAKPQTLTHRPRSSWPWIYIVLLLLGLAVISDIGEDLFTAPRIRLFESIACINYYSRHNPSLLDPDGSVPERFCKVDPVQSKVASVLGWQLFFDSIPAILLPVPYGYIADTYGRKWVLVTALTGYALTWASTLFFVGVLQLPLEYVWLSSLFSLVGGGGATGTTLLTTMVADVVPPEFRSTVFFYRFCTDQVADVFVPPIASYLMSKDVWIPLVLAVLFGGLAAIIALALPETLPIAVLGPPNHIDDATNDSARIDQNKHSIKWKDKIKRGRESFNFVTRDLAVLTLVSTFFISKIGRQANNVLFQYASKKYNWTLAQAGLLISLRASVNITLFAVILPFIMNFTLSGLSPPLRDLWIGKASVVLLVLGTSILFLSQTVFLMIIGLIVFILGMGFVPIVRSLVTYLVECHHASDIGRLYALISVMEGLGSLVAGPGMAWAFRLGMSMGEWWLGLPFGFATLLFLAVSIVVFSIRI
ncbi:major facilitator superfamily domain-containing protein [Calycina marina]|uniref:Major facilitator superfamily domain-containing protein n=1 Tax=Calycina marina TaxID=1763456 RepID=A0A9P8CB96_9HELO|nr:major facilitator superfamily domain-containing protein [Calycina marina]